jgi:hypothetical protein
MRVAVSLRLVPDWARESAYVVEAERLGPPPAGDTLDARLATLAGGSSWCAASERSGRWT